VLGYAGHRLFCIGGGMRAIALVALGSFVDFRGEERAAGEWFEASPIDAVRLINIRKVRLAPKSRAPVVEAPRKRTYRRRDLTAEP
jgi:hypothetical protein